MVPRPLVELAFNLLGALALVGLAIGVARFLSKKPLIPSNFSITDSKINVVDLNTVWATLEITNTGTSVHEAAVTVKLLNGLEEILVSSEKRTGPVEAGEAYRDTWMFTRPGLARELSQATATIVPIS